MNKHLLADYGLKYNPFAQDIPKEALYLTDQLKDFCLRIENYKISQGGFALICGQPGLGKSVALRYLATQLETIRDVVLAEFEHPQSAVCDFYRELGHRFGVPLQFNNRWHTFNGLRERFVQHIKSSLIRPVLLVDEAQDMLPSVLNELRALSSAKFDSTNLLTVIFAGDNRFLQKLERIDLLPLKSRVSPMLLLDHYSAEQLLDLLEHLLIQAGNPALVADGLRQTLCEHAMGNIRSLVIMGNELLQLAVQKEKPQIDEKLFFECFSADRLPHKPNPRRTK